MTNMGRNLCDMTDGLALGKTHCLMDGDKLWSEGLKECLRSIGCEPKKLPPRSPTLNAYIERFIGTTRRELRSDILPMSTEGLEWALREHVTYYNEERNHQSLSGHRCPVDRDHDSSTGGTGPVRCRSRLVKTLNFYYREAS